MKRETPNNDDIQGPWVLVGFGDKGKNCGNIVPILSCQTCHKAHYVKSRCQQKGCPDCFEIWHTFSTAKIKVRLTSEKAKIKNYKKRIKHVIISPSKEKIKNYDYVQLREQAIKYVYSISHVYVFKRNRKTGLQLSKYGPFTNRKHGYTITKKDWDNIELEDKQKIKHNYKVINSAPSGVLIYHPWRTTKQALAISIKLGIKKWDFVRSQGDNWKNYVVYSPHFHFVGYLGWLKAPEENGDWVYKTIEETTEKGKQVAELDPKDVYNVVYYLLTHTATQKDRDFIHSYVYTGNLADRNGNSAEERWLKQNGILTVTDSDIILNSKTKKDLKKIKARCHCCNGKLWYMFQNLVGFLKAYEIPFDDVIKWDDVFNRVKQLDIKSYLKLNVLDCIQLKRGKPPPIDYEKYIID